MKEEMTYTKEKEKSTYLYKLAVQKNFTLGVYSVNVGFKEQFLKYTHTCLQLTV